MEIVAEGREGPKSSEEESCSSWSGLGRREGGVEGRSERGAGGREGPITRRFLEVLSLLEVLQERACRGIEVEGSHSSLKSEERFRFERWGGREGPTADILWLKSCSRAGITRPRRN